jgi:hypothetical protein
MKLIKLDAIDSTNDFLKRLSGEQPLDNFTVVSTENQTHGKGQMGAKWDSETGKNLMFSVIINNLLNNISQIFKQEALHRASFYWSNPSRFQEFRRKVGIKKNWCIRFAHLSVA